MARYHPDINQAGARVVGISVDTPEQNAAMVGKLHLPFPLLSDPDGERAIKPYGVWHEGATFARPAVILVNTDGYAVVRQVGEDFADRLSEDDLIKEIESFGLPPTWQEPPAQGTPRPGLKAFPARALRPYFYGSQYAVKALSGRVPEAREDAAAMDAEYDRYLRSLRWLKEQQ